MTRAAGISGRGRVRLSGGAFDGVRHRSLWLQEALAGEPPAEPRLEGDVRADMCIVGGGFTGLWTALALKEREPALDVVLVEGDICGGGASGRNGGFVLSLWAKFGSLAAVCGGEEAARLARASAAAVGEIAAFCREQGIDAHVREDGWLWAATNPSQAGAWDSTIAAAERHGDGPSSACSRARPPAAPAPPATWRASSSPPPPPCTRRGSPAACAASRSSAGCASTRARR
jgi:hypothetical protein